MEDNKMIEMNEEEKEVSVMKKSGNGKLVGMIVAGVVAAVGVVGTILFTKKKQANPDNYTDSDWVEDCEDEITLMSVDVNEEN